MAADALALAATNVAAWLGAAVGFAESGGPGGPGGLAWPGWLMPSAWPLDRPWLLLALPSALLPWWQRPRGALLWSWAPLLPPDRASDAIALALKAVAALAIAALVIGAAGPYRPAYEVERVGQGAEIVLLVDRSRSMDQIFMPPRQPGQVTNLLSEANRVERADKSRPSKQMVARQLLAEFTATRSADRYAVIAFSTLPIRVLGFTQKPAAVQAAIAAGQIGRGLAETDIGLAMLDALELFRDRPYSGSRIVLLVSDGGDVIEPEKQALIARLVRDRRVRIYWIYIRSPRSPGLRAADQAQTNASTTPEYFLHTFFGGLGTPYRAFEAENPEALKQAIADVGRLENLPITYLDTVPRGDLMAWAQAAALALLALWALAHRLELRRWR